MKATGIINTAACIPGTPQEYGTEVAPGVVGHIHQHIFCARLDMEVDGPENTVVECDTVAPPMGPGNPMGNAFKVVERPLATELEARRRVDFERMRYWKIVNRGRRNHVGGPTAYKLETPSAVQPYLDPAGPSGRRAGFIYNHLWVTPYRPDERFPAGDFMNHSTGAEGLRHEGLGAAQDADAKADERERGDGPQADAGELVAAQVRDEQGRDQVHGAVGQRRDGDG